MSAARGANLRPLPPSLWQRLADHARSLYAPVDPLLAASIDDEIENHILERTERLIDEGMPAKHARREAARRFGSTRRVKDELQRIGQSTEGSRRGNEFFGSVMRDLKQGVRQVRSSPGFALAVIATIGLGVGANAAVFSVTDAVLLRPLPFDEPDELVTIDDYFPDDDRTLDRMTMERANAWRDADPGLDGLLLFAQRSFVRTGVDDPESIDTFAVSPDWLATLGARPVLGRSFTADDGAPGAPGTIVLSYRLWRDRFGADRDVVGGSIELDSRDFTVIGVMPPDFTFPVYGRNAAWVPLLGDGTIGGLAPSRGVSLIGRIPDGIDIAAVQERLDVVSAGLDDVEPLPNGWRVRAQPLDRFRANADVERALWVLTGAVAVMLLIATINAANLLLVRATARREEVGVRMALGASRGRIVRQHLIENAVLVVAGGVLAVALARVVLGSIVGLLPSELTFFLAGEIAVNRRVLWFAMAVTAAAGLLLSVVPALRGTAKTTATAWSSSNRSTRWLGNGLVVAEVALTVALLVGAGLMINSFMRLTAVDPGYEPDSMVQATLSLPNAGYPDSAAQRAFFDRLSERLRALPGISGVSLVTGTPAGGSSITFGVTPQAEGQDPKELPDLFIPSASVSPGYFAAIGAPIVAGRGFTDEDTRESGHVIIDRDTASFFWGPENPIGRRFRLDAADGDYPWLTVVGLVGEFKMLGQDDRQGSLDIFYPLPPDGARSFMSIVMRTGLEPASVMPSIRAAVREVDADLPIYQLTTGRAALDAENDKPRFFLLMMANFAAIALALALIGTYGVLAFAVRQRQRELGVRIALGARSVQIKTMVLGQGVGLAAAGVAIGLAVAWSLGGVAQSLLFEVEASDPSIFAAVAALMLACAATACWVPARRATRVDPVNVLRAD